MSLTVSTSSRLRHLTVMGRSSKLMRFLMVLTTKIAAVDGGFQTEIIGNGLYITHENQDYTFAFATPEGNLMNVVTSEVNNISDLPTM